MRSPVTALLLTCALAAAASRAPAQCSTRLGDIAPGSLDTAATPPTWRAVGDGRIDIGDVVVALRSAVGLQDIAYWQAGCPQVMGDVAPGWLDTSTSPPTWLPTGDGERNLGDVIALLRMTAGLHRISANLTYYKDAKVAIDDRCTRCHVTGGVAPFSLVGWDAVRPATGAIREPIALGQMPPWPPSGSCAPLVGSRALDDKDRAVLLSWLAQGALEGNPADEPAPRTPPAPVAYDVVMPLAEPYTPSSAVSDDYRCFLVDWPVAQRSYVTAFHAAPDVDPLVHHVIAYAVDPADVAEFRALDDGELGPGYTCYGGPGGPDGAARWVGAWAPGGEGGAFPADTGIRMEPGSLVVVQIHYNMDFTPPVPDRTVVEMRTALTVGQAAVVALWPADGFMIPAGAPSTTYTESWVGAASMLPEDRDELNISFFQPYVLRDVALHQHQLGVSTQLEIVRQSGAVECVLDIPNWDFHWQGTYRLATPVTLGSNDSIRVTCTWDNSPENQPWVGGVQQDPRDVWWGEGSRDEMCLGLAYVTAR